MGFEKKKLMRDLIEFVKELRELNSRFKVGKKFDFQVMANLFVYLPLDGKDVIIYGNPFRIDLKSRRISQPRIIVIEYEKHQMRVRFADDQEEREFGDLDKIVEYLIDNREIPRMDFEDCFPSEKSIEAVENLVKFFEGSLIKLPEDEYMRWRELDIIDEDGIVRFEDDTIRMLKDGEEPVELNLLALLYEGSVAFVYENDGSNNKRWYLNVKKHQ